MTTSINSVLPAPGSAPAAHWDARARVAREARRAAAESRRGRPISFVAAVGMGVA